MTVTVATTSTRGTIAYIASPKRLSLGVTRCVSQCVCVLYVLCVPCGKALASVCVSAVVIKTQQKLNAKLKVVDRQLKKNKNNNNNNNNHNGIGNSNNVECPFGQGKVKAILGRREERKKQIENIYKTIRNSVLPKVYYFSIDFEANKLRNNFEYILE